MRIRLLCTEADRAALGPVLDALAQKGIKAGTKDAAVTLCALSESFYADAKCMEALFTLVSRGAELLPLQLDAAPIPEALMNAIYARNVIAAPGRSPELIAARIADALPKKKSRTPQALIIAGVAALALAGLLIWRALQKTPEEPLPVMMPDAPAVTYVNGLTAEDLAKIVDVVIVGEEVRFYTLEDLPEDGALPDWEVLATRDEDWLMEGYLTWTSSEGHWHSEEDTDHWYSKADGHEYVRTRYEDLSYIALMPNLRNLSLTLVEAETLPRLEGLTKLESLRLSACEIGDLDWVEGASIRTLRISNNTGSLSDFNVLTGCTELRELMLNLYNTEKADFSAFAPPNLESVRFSSFDFLAEAPNLTAMGGCTKLKSVELNNVAVADLSMLENAAGLEHLEIKGLHELRDISALRGKEALRSVTIRDCDGIADLRPLAECSGLTELFLMVGNHGAPLELPFLTALPELETLRLCLYLTDIDFLRELGGRGHLQYLQLNSSVEDWSGLEGIGEIRRLEIAPLDATPFREIAPYLQGVAAEELALAYFEELDLSLVPKVSRRLGIYQCGITDLATMPADWSTPELNLTRCRKLRSLQGLENQRALGQGKGSLEIEICPGIADWSALEGMVLDSLSISGCYLLPELEHLRVGSLRVEAVPDVTELSFLEALDASRRCDIALVGLEVQDLSALRRFSGDTLTVSPQLAEQAADLVRAGNFGEYRVDYPHVSWDPEAEDFTLQSVEELETLPAALLRRVRSLGLAGDQLYDPEYMTVYRGRGGVLIMDNWDNGESGTLGPGIVGSIDVLAPLTGLRSLALSAQPLEDLDGIQVLDSLESLSISYASALRDVSAAFACQQLRTLTLTDCPVESLQGIQNLYDLRELDLRYTQVRDLTPLLSLSELETVRVSEDMGRAIGSLDGAEYKFTLEIE